MFTPILLILHFSTCPLVGMQIWLAVVTRCAKVNADPNTHTLTQGAALIVYLLSLHPSNTDVSYKSKSSARNASFTLIILTPYSSLVVFIMYFKERAQAWDSCFNIGWWKEEKESLCTMHFIYNFYTEETLFPFLSLITVSNLLAFS